MTADDRLNELLAQTEELRAAPPLKPAGSAEARLVEDFIADHAARRVSPPAAAYPIPDPLGPVTVDTLLTNPDRLGTRITVDQMLNHPGRIAARLADLERTHELARALIPPGPPLTRWQRARRRVAGAFTGARERVALAIAPWLEGYDR